MMITRTVQVEVHISAEDLIREPREAAWILRELSRALTEEALLRLREFAGEEQFKEFAAIASGLAQQICKVAGPSRRGRQVNDQ